MGFFVAVLLAITSGVPRMLVREQLRNTMMKYPLSILVLIAAFVDGCASLPPGSDFPKTRSVAFDHPEQTVVGRKFEKAAREHDGNSGFPILGGRRRFSDPGANDQ
jgi:hypothetical protein